MQRRLRPTGEGLDSRRLASAAANAPKHIHSHSHSRDPAWECGEATSCSSRLRAFFYFFLGGWKRWKSPETCYGEQVMGALMQKSLGSVVAKFSSLHRAHTGSHCSLDSSKTHSSPRPGETPNCGLPPETSRGSHGERIPLIHKLVQALPQHCQHQLVKLCIG